MIMVTINLTVVCLHNFLFFLAYAISIGFFPMTLDPHLLLFVQIDPSILGGLVVEFDQKVFDMSIKTRAKQMEKFLREPINFDNF